MNSNNEPMLPIVNRAELREDWPTHRGTPEFWEELGRTVATFSQLEDIVARAWFGLTSSHEFNSRDEAEAAYSQWRKGFEELLTDALYKLTSKIEKAFDKDDRVPAERAAGIIGSLNELRVWRNVLCHGVWQDFGADGSTHPKFFTKTKDGPQRLENRLTRESISSIRAGTVDLMCEIVNTLSAAGVSFPGIVLPDVDDT